jgi:hypothetical protein
MRIVPALAALSLLLAACGGGGSDGEPAALDESTTTGADTTTAPPETTAPETTAAPTTAAPETTAPETTAAPTTIPPTTIPPTTAPAPVETDELGRVLGTFPESEADVDYASYDPPERALAFVSTLTGNCREYRQHDAQQTRSAAAFMSALLDFEVDEVVDYADCGGAGLGYTYTGLQFVDPATALRVGQSLDPASFIEGVCANSVTVDDTVILLTGTTSVDVSSTADDLVDWIGAGEVTTRCTIDVRDQAPAADSGSPTEPEAGGVYPEELRTNFIDACIGGGGDAETCTCTIDEVAKRLSLTEYIEAELALAEGASLPAEITDSFAACLAQ